MTLKPRVTTHHSIIIDWSPHTVHFIPVIHLFCNWKFISLNFPHLFHLYLFPLTITSLFSVSVTQFLFCYVCSFVLFLRFQIYVKSYSIVFLCLTWFT